MGVGRSETVTSNNEYAFDVKLAAVVRVHAPNERAARKLLGTVLDACEPSGPFMADNARKVESVRLTEFSLARDDAAGPHLFEINGKSVE